jgi:hypothetical protein
MEANSAHFQNAKVGNLKKSGPVSGNGNQKQSKRRKAS